MPIPFIVNTIPPVNTTIIIETSLCYKFISIHVIRIVSIIFTHFYILL